MIDAEERGRVITSTIFNNLRTIATSIFKNLHTMQPDSCLCKGNEGQRFPASTPANRVLAIPIVTHTTQS